MLTNTNTFTHYSSATILIDKVNQLIDPTNNLIRAVYKEHVNALETQKRDVQIKMDALYTEMIKHTTSLISLNKDQRLVKNSDLKYVDLTILDTGQNDDR